MKHISYIFFIVIILLSLQLMLVKNPGLVNVQAQSRSETVFADSLSTTWENWSWGGQVSEIRPSGSDTVLSFQAFDPWSGLYLHRREPLNVDKSMNVTFKLRNPGALPLALALFKSHNEAIRFVSLDRFTKVLPDGFVEVIMPLSELNSESFALHGFVIQVHGSASGQSFELDNLVFEANVSLASPSPIVSSSRPTVTPIQSPTPTPTSTAVASAQGYAVRDGEIYYQNKRIRLNGVNWFGAETETLVPHGLWSRNYKEMITQMKSLGFNAVRLPFCPATLRNKPTTSINYDLNPDLLYKNSLEVMDMLMLEFQRQDMMVLLDHHRPDCQAISELWYTPSYSETQWIQDLVFVAKRYARLSSFMGVDLKNEPHGQATWGTNNPATDWNLAAEKAGQAVVQANPNMLIFVEGIGDNPVCSSTFSHGWGSNLEAQRCAPINPAFIPAHKLVFSPHIYGPDVYNQSYFHASNFPDNMSEIWDTHFGFLRSQGFAVALGEWGGKFGSLGGSAQDIRLQEKLVDYLSSRSMCNSFYWSFNPNSSDTGGILQDDWQSIWPQKIDLIHRYQSACR